MNKRSGCCEIDGLLEPRFFRALCDPSRIALLARLAQCCEPCSVSQLAQCCPTDLSVVSRHLAMLRDAGILSCEKRGKEVFYRVRYDELIKTLRALADGFEACCGGTPDDQTPSKILQPNAQASGNSS
ncbi:MAG: winged helix-turn-helix transcriptional regulator [Planctomycetes bacterium]|nr:winged helix-turn-helix transcriptional regulator [Planctomycetota bacterium]